MVLKYYKVKVWITEQESVTYIFVGDNHDDATKTILQKLEGISKGSKRVSLSSSEQNTLQKVFGANYTKYLGFKHITSQLSAVKYVLSWINPDDSINWLKKKLYSHLYKDLSLRSHEGLYMWVNKKFTVTQSVLRIFLTNCFKTDKRISFQQFASNVLNFFSVSIPDIGLQFVDTIQAYDYLKSIEFGVHDEPIFFKYANDIYFEYINYNPLKDVSNTKSSDGIDTLNVMAYDSLLLESFGLASSTDDCLHVIGEHDFAKMLNSNPELSKLQKIKLTNKYFPNVQDIVSKESNQNVVKFVNVIESAESHVINYQADVSGQNLGTYVNYLHLRVNESNFNKRQELETLFESFVTSSDVPFVKFKTINNNIYKVDKESLLGIKNELIGKWTEAKITQVAKGTETNYILFKVKYTRDVYCSLLLFDNMCYDIKFSFGNVMKETEKDIVKFLSKIDNIISQVKKLYPQAYIPFVDKQFAKSNELETNTKVLRWLTSNQIKSEKHIINYTNFIKVIQNKLYTYFNIIRNPNKNILHLQYKKIDNYLKFENIQVYITNNFTKDRDEMIRRITNEFILSREDAEKELDKWLSQNEIEIYKMGDKVFIKPKNDNYVNIKIRLTSSIDLNFSIEGAKSQAIQDRILRLLFVALDMSASKSNLTLSSKVGDVDNIENFVFAKKTSPSSPFSSKLKSFSNNQDNEFDEFDEFENYDDFGELFEDDEDLKALEMEFLKEVANEASQLQLNKKEIKNQKTLDDDNDDDTEGKDEDSIMKSYFMNMLKSADRELIDYKVPKGDKSQKRYSTVCQWNDRRQPVVVNKEEFTKVKQYNKDIKYIKTGSTPELQEKNFYLCPQVWCPKSKVALTYKDYKEKYNESCPFPEVEETPILLTNHYWGKGDKGQTREHFPGYLDAFTHPNKLCLPCCFKKEAKEGSKNKQKEDSCRNQWNSEPQIEMEEPEIVGNEKYIKAEIVVPLEVSRYGLLPKELNEVFGSKKCGNGLDGKGLMNDKTDCMLRKGINQKTQSFFNALFSILDNPSITNMQSFLKRFNQYVTVERFVGLENGKIVKLFINSNFDIFDVKNFAAFRTWFLDVKQRHYIKVFKLKEIAEVLESLPRDAMFNDSSLPKHKIILREFLIYNAYVHFVKYVNDPLIEKDFNLLIDFVQNETSWLNVKHYNIAIIEHEPTENRTYIICPFNRNAKTVFDKSDPFIFILKQNSYYEPLYHVKIDHGDIIATSKFVFKFAPEHIRNLINFYMENCSTDKKVNLANDIELYLRSLGFIIKRYVIDYSFKICGFLISQNNLFIPLKTKIDIYDLTNAQFIYYDKIPSYKCTLSKDQIDILYKNLYKHTKDEFYKLTHLVESKNKTRIVGLFLNNTYFVPVNYIEEEDIQYINDVIEDDLNIFIGNEKDDVRRQRVQRDMENRKMFKMFTDEVNGYFEKHKEARDEYNFLLDTINPFPKSYRRKKLVRLVQKVVEHSTSMKRLQDKINLTRFTYQYIEDVLSASSKSFNLLLKQLFGLKKKYKKAPTELLFDQKDVIDGKLQDKIRYIQNPYSSLLERLDKHMKEYITEFTNVDEHELFKKYINRDTVYEDVPYKFRKMLAGHQLVNYSEYNINTLYDLFLRISRIQGGTNMTDIPLLRSVMIKQIVHAYKENNLTVLLENPSYLYNEKMTKLKLRSLENIVTITESMSYYPSYFELVVLARIARVNLIVIGRKRKDNEQGIEIFFNNSSKYIMMEHTYDRFKYYDLFRIIIKDPKTDHAQILFRKHEVQKQIFSLLRLNKSKSKKV